MTMTNRLICLALLLTSTCLCQPKKGSLGITSAIVETPNLGIAYAVSDNMRIGSSLGVDMSKDSLGTTSSLHFDASIWRYTISSENFSTFFGGAVGFDSKSMPTATTSLAGIAGLYGAEYWLSPKFAIYGLLQVGYETGKDAGAAVTHVKTSAKTGLTWYF
jgi:hypothetical protein